MAGATMRAGLTGQMLQSFMAREGLPQADFAAKAGYSRAAVGHMVTGVRNGDTLRVAKVANDAGFFQALAADATDGVMADAILTGPKVNLSPLAVATKAREELLETVTAIEAAITDLVNARSAEDFSPAAHARIARVLHEAPEAKTALGTLLRVFCEAFEASPADIYAAHLAELRQKGLIADGTEVAKNVHRVRRAV